MKTTESKTEIIVRYVYYCDICNKLAKTKCCKCGMDLCNKCVEKEIDTGGDYRGDCYCKTCWDLGKQYRISISILEDQIELLSDEYSEICKNERMTNKK